VILLICEENYFELPGLSASDIKELWRSPAHYKESKLHPSKATPAMELGTAIHAAILEPSSFINKYVAMDDTDICAEIGGAKPKATKKYKEWKSEYIKENKGKNIIEISIFDQILELATVVRKHSIAGNLLSELGETELPIQWIHRETGTAMKAKPDFVTESGKIIDIKTCEDARPTAFQRNIWTYLYHFQAAVYQEAIAYKTGEIYPFIFIAIEKTPPHGIMVYQLDETAIELARSEVVLCIKQYEICKQKDIWPAYTLAMREILLPNWAQLSESVVD
jgi:exodeoxyribonuclease VIII